MPWTRRRRSELPPDWPAIRSRVLHRDRESCQLRRPGCIGWATEVDHAGDRNDHSMSNLRASCSWCHARRTSAQGHQRRNELRALRKRPVERHPGLR